MVRRGNGRREVAVAGSIAVELGSGSRLIWGRNENK
jgi:hypothetical protein